MKLAEMNATRPVLMFGLGGIITGLLSYLTIKYGPQLRFSVFLDASQGTSIVPGLIFGVLIAACNFKFGLREKFALASIVALTGFAWILAFDCTVRAQDYLQSYHRTVQVDPAPPADPAAPTDAPATDRPDVQTQNLPFVMGAAGMVGGLVGGLGTMFAVALVNARFRHARGLLPIVIAATLLGSLVELLRWSGDRQPSFCSYAGRPQ